MRTHKHTAPQDTVNAFDSEGSPGIENSLNAFDSEPDPGNAFDSEPGPGDAFDSEPGPGNAFDSEPDPGSSSAEIDAFDAERSEPGAPELGQPKKRKRVPRKKASDIMLNLNGRTDEELNKGCENKFCAHGGNCRKWVAVCAFDCDDAKFRDDIEASRHYYWKEMNQPDRKDWLMRQVRFVAVKAPGCRQFDVAGEQVCAEIFCWFHGVPKSAYSAALTGVRNNRHAPDGRMLGSVGGAPLRAAIIDFIDDIDSKLGEDVPPKANEHGAEGWRSITTISKQDLFLSFRSITGKNVSKAYFMSVLTMVYGPRRDSRFGKQRIKFGHDVVLNQCKECETVKAKLAEVVGSNAPRNGRLVAVDAFALKVVKLRSERHRTAVRLARERQAWWADKARDAEGTCCSHSLNILFITA